MKTVFLKGLVLAAFSSSIGLACDDKPAACQFYVDDFALTSTYEYHAIGYNQIRVNLFVAGSPSKVEMSVKYRPTFSSDGNVLTEAEKEVTIPAILQKDGRYLVSFTTEKNNMGNQTKNEISQFSFTADFDNKLTLRNGPFSSDDTSAKYKYSKSVLLDSNNPNNSASFLYQDGGSPIFKSRVICLQNSKK